MKSHRTRYFFGRCAICDQKRRCRWYPRGYAQELVKACDNCKSKLHRRNGPIRSEYDQQIDLFGTVRRYQ